jgi:hypothetical protein
LRGGAFSLRQPRSARKPSSKKRASLRFADTARAFARAAAGALAGPSSTTILTRRGSCILLSVIDTPLGRAPTHSATSDLGRNSSGNGPTTNTYVAARSPEGTACGLAGGRTAREISRSVPSGCGGSARSPRGRNVTRPRESRRKSNLEAHAEQSQKNSVLAYRFSCAYKSPAFRSLNSSRHAGLTQRLTIRVHP